MNATGGTRLEDVLDIMLAEHGAPTPAALSAASRLHPEHRAALLAFAASWAEERHLPPSRPQPTVDAAAAAAARDLFARALAARERPATLSDLAARAGTTLHDLALRCRLDPSVLSRLDAGRITTTSIGHVLPTRLATLLGATREAVAATFDGTRPRLMAAGFLGPAHPPAREDFRKVLEETGTDPDVVAELLPEG